MCSQHNSINSSINLSTSREFNNNALFNVNINF